MLTRRDALKLLLASPALRLTPVAATPLAVRVTCAGPRTITLPDVFWSGRVISVTINGRTFQANGGVIVC